MAKAKKSSVQTSVKREPGIDLLRCTGLLFVVCLHCFLYNGFYYEPQTGFLMWLANTFRWLFYTCNGLFMMLTGYLKSRKPFQKGYYRSLAPILISYVLVCLLTFPIRHFLLGEKLTLWGWIEKMLTFGNYAWYVEMYIGLLLFSPILNFALEKLTRREDLLNMTAIMLVITALPSVVKTTLIPNYWVALYPFTYYILGAVIRRLQPKVKVWQGLGGAMLICMGLGLVSLLTTDEGFSKGFTQGYGGFWTTAVACCVFLGLYRANVPKKLENILSWLSGGCFEGYILSKPLDMWAYPLVSDWHTPAMYPLVCLCVTLPIYVTVILVGKAVNAVSKRITKALM